MPRTIAIDLVGDVVTQVFRGIGENVGVDISRIHHHPINQHRSVLVSGIKPDVLLCHTTAEFFLDEGATEDAVDAASDFADSVIRYAEAGETLIVLNTVFIGADRIVGQQHLKRLRAVNAINEQFMRCADRCAQVSLADVAGVVAHTGLRHAINRQNELAMRMPYTKHVLPQLVAEYNRTIAERYQSRRKVVVVDADNTLWDGIVGEDGLAGIYVNEPYPGNVYRRFQQQLLTLKESGVLLALASKNSERVVREAFARLSMPLDWSDFAAIRVNWQPKSRSLRQIAAELNVGLDSLVFIDDSPREIDEVSSNLPMVDCYRFVARHTDEALSLLSGVSQLGTWSFTEEDREKTTLYRQQKQRQSSLADARSVDDYIRTLNIHIAMGVNRQSAIPRVAQLTNKTNQFNLTTRRCSEGDIMQLMRAGHVFDFRVIDRFGDMGIVGTVAVVDRHIELFLLSCRALGRQIENNMLDAVLQYFDGQTLSGCYVPTRKNAIVAEFYANNGFEAANVATPDDESDQRFILKNRLSRAVVLPVELVMSGDDRVDRTFRATDTAVAEPTLMHPDLAPLRAAQ